MSNNLYTLIWGKSFWETLHNVSFGYPDNPTEEDKINYKNFYKSVQYVLPCCLCKKHYTDMINNSELKIDDKYFNNMASLSLWVYNIHEYVNQKLNIKSGITYDYLCNKYSFYKTDNDLTKNQRINAFKMYYNSEPPMLDYNIAIKFINEGSKYFPDFENTLNKYYNISDKFSDEWLIRNNKCNKCIKYMRLYDICGINNSILTKPELYLIMHLSTTLSIDDLKKMIF